MIEQDACGDSRRIFSVLPAEWKTLYWCDPPRGGSTPTTLPVLEGSALRQTIWPFSKTALKSASPPRRASEQPRDLLRRVLHGDRVQPGESLFLQKRVHHQERVASDEAVRPAMLVLVEIYRRPERTVLL